MFDAVGVHRDFVEDWLSGGGDVTRNEAVQEHIDIIRSRLEAINAKECSREVLGWARDVCYLLNYIMELEEQFEEAATLLLDDDEDE